MIVRTLAAAGGLSLRALLLAGLFALPPASFGYSEAGRPAADPIRVAGQYPVAPLQAYVQRVGERIARAAAGESEPRPLRFVVLDDPEPRAYALASGRIHVNRGLLPYLGSEAELAAILAIEVAHVVSSASAPFAGDPLETLGTLSLDDLVDVLRPLPFVPIPDRRPAAEPAARLEPDAVAPLARSARTERHAAEAAAAYLARAGYAPAAVPGALRRVAEAAQVLGTDPAFEPFSAPVVYSAVRALAPAQGTFERTPESLDAAVARIALENPTALGAVNREGYLAQIEGTVLGPSEREGTVRGGVFYHPGLGVKVTLPPGWRAANSPERFVAAEPSGEAIIELTVEHRPRDGRMDAVLARRLRSTPLDEAWDYDGKVPRYSAVARAPSAYGIRLTRFVVCEQGEHAYVFALSARSDASRSRYEPLLEKTVAAMTQLGPADIGRAAPWRLALVRTGRETALEEFARANGVAPEDLYQVRALNHATGERLAPGTLVKLPR